MAALGALLPTRPGGFAHNTGQTHDHPQGLEAVVHHFSRNGGHELLVSKLQLSRVRWLLGPH